ncbi:MAG: 5'/3'-nucleotidase SurE [Desulfosalsimonadaceae bacterium]
MKIVISNDDGYEAPGLEALRKAAEPLGDLVVVAPYAPQSGVGHSITLKEEVYVRQADTHEYVVDGSPADCARLALKVMAPDADWLIAGINAGANLGTDVYPSGTVAAAREAAIMGTRAIAISQYQAAGHKIDWAATSYHAAAILALIMEKELAAGRFWNINLPHPLDFDSVLRHRHCGLEKRPHDFDFVQTHRSYSYSGDIHARPRSGGSDVDVCYGGEISLTQMGY